MKTRCAVYIWIVILTGLLGGCGEVLNEFYISNHTDDPVRVVMTPRFMEQVELRAGPVRDAIESSIRSSLGETLSFEQNGEEISFTAPGRTTVFIGFSSGGNQPFEVLSVGMDDAHVQITPSNYRQHFAISDRVVGAVVHVLDVR